MTKAHVKLVKKSSGFKAAPKGAKADGTNFVIVDNQDSTCTVMGVDSAGAQVPIDAVATLSATSSDPSKLTVDPPVGMQFAMHGILPTTPGSPANVAVIATWNDGSIGPFSFTLPCDVAAGPAGSIIVTPGTPIAR